MESAILYELRVQLNRFSSIIYLRNCDGYNKMFALRTHHACSVYLSSSFIDIISVEHAPGKGQGETIIIAWSQNKSFWNDKV